MAIRFVIPSSLRHFACVSFYRLHSGTWFAVLATLAWYSKFRINVLPPSTPSLCRAGLSSSTLFSSSSRFYLLAKCAGPVRADAAVISSGSLTLPAGNLSGTPFQVLRAWERLPGTFPKAGLHVWNSLPSPCGLGTSSFRGPSPGIPF